MSRFPIIHCAAYAFTFVTHIGTEYLLPGAGYVVMVPLTIYNLFFLFDRHCFSITTRDCTVTIYRRTIRSY